MQSITSLSYNGENECDICVCYDRYFQYIDKSSIYHCSLFSLPVIQNIHIGLSHQEGQYSILKHHSKTILLNGSENGYMHNITLFFTYIFYIVNVLIIAISMIRDGLISN